MRKSLLTFSLLASLCNMTLYSQAHAASPICRTITVFTAGSLRSAFREIAQDYEQKNNNGRVYPDTEECNVDGDIDVKTDSAFSGLQRQRIESGEKADVFASADIDNPLTLYEQGLSDPVINFTSNRLVVVTRPETQLSPLADELLQQLQSDNITKIGTFPPENDPLGAYTQDVFRKADAIAPGSFQQLNEKSIFFKEELVPREFFTSGGIIDWGLQKAPTELKVDAFFAYYTSALAALAIAPDLNVWELPENLAVQADYGLTLLKSASPDAAELVDYVLSPDGQTTLAKYGFSPASTSSKSIPEPVGIGGVVLAGVAFAVQKKLASIISVRALIPFVLIMTVTLSKMKTSFLSSLFPVPCPVLVILA